MSKFIKALTDMMQGNSKNSHKKVAEPEKFRRSEFKNLIQQEIVPVKKDADERIKVLEIATVEELCC
ncbi:UNVERIFIED_CONTAM: hypothetical protein K2H54_023184 [Gekko kuhli]